MTKQPYEKLIEHFKSPSRLAEQLGVSRAAVCKWKIEGVPVGRALELEQVSGGAVTATEILLAAQQAA